MNKEDIERTDEREKIQNLTRRKEKIIELEKRRKRRRRIKEKEEKEEERERRKRDREKESMCVCVINHKITNCNEVNTISVLFPHTKI